MALGEEAVVAAKTADLVQTCRRVPREKLNFSIDKILRPDFGVRATPATTTEPTRHLSSPPLPDDEADYHCSLSRGEGGGGEKKKRRDQLVISSFYEPVAQSDYTLDNNNPKTTTTTWIKDATFRFDNYYYSGYDVRKSLWSCCCSSSKSDDDVVNTKGLDLSAKVDKLVGKDAGHFDIKCHVCKMSTDRKGDTCMNEQQQHPGAEKCSNLQSGAPTHRVLYGKNLLEAKNCFTSFWNSAVNNGGEEYGAYEAVKIDPYRYGALNTENYGAMFPGTGKDNAKSTTRRDSDKKVEKSSSSTGCSPSSSPQPISCGYFPKNTKTIPTKSKRVHVVDVSHGQFGNKRSAGPREAEIFHKKQPRDRSCSPERVMRNCLMSDSELTNQDAIWRYGMSSNRSLNDKTSATKSSRKSVLRLTEQFHQLSGSYATLNTSEKYLNESGYNSPSGVDPEETGGLNVSETVSTTTTKFVDEDYERPSSSPVHPIDCNHQNNESSNFDNDDEESSVDLKKSEDGNQVVVAAAAPANESGQQKDSVDTGDDFSDANKLKWPIWVYCTRYSARPSSGPRSRRQKKQNQPATQDEKRARTAFTSSQLSRLRQEFQDNRYLTEKRRINLATELKLSEAQVKIWFQNKRAKMKKAAGRKNPLALQLMAQGLYNHTAQK